MSADAGEDFDLDPNFVPVDSDPNFSPDPYIMPAQQVAATFDSLDRIGGNVERLFGQAEVWVDRHGVHRQLDEMPLDYLSAVQKFIENRTVDCRIAIGDYVTASLAAFDASDHVADAVLASLDEDEGRSDAGWLADQPLYRRISQLLGDRRFAR